jgi:hypothetical protein
VLLAKVAMRGEIRVTAVESTEIKYTYTVALSTSLYLFLQDVSTIYTVACATAMGRP